MFDAYIQYRPDEQIAIHEAAHAVVAIAKGGTVRKATIEPEADTAGHVVVTGIEDSYGEALCDLSAQVAVDRLACLRGGPAPDTEGSGRDFHNAAKSLASRMSWRTRDDEAIAWAGRCKRHASVIVTVHWAEIESLADELLDRRSLDETDVRLYFQANHRDFYERFLK
ncbi:MAG: hypothetical protein KDA42_06135 [Planctomycetales bacterium]|nr:hypothetical protein [Planctomycetales bacterium]